MDNLRFYEMGRHVPQEAKKEILGGKLKGFTDVNPMFRIKKLTEMFGMCGVGWYTETTKQWTEQNGNEVKCFCNINLYVCTDGEWSRPIEGTGGSSFVSTTKNGLEVSDECYKMAYTDALSVACKSLGIAADVYWEKDRTKYTVDTEETKPKAAPKAAPKAQATKPVPATAPVANAQTTPVAAPTSQPVIKAEPAPADAPAQQIDPLPFENENLFNDYQNSVLMTMRTMGERGALTQTAMSNFCLDLQAKKYWNDTIKAEFTKIKQQYIKI